MIKKRKTSEKGCLECIQSNSHHTEKCLLSGLLDDKQDKRRLLQHVYPRKNTQFVRHARRSHTKTRIKCNE